ncbi:DEAD/DEAH box helicase [Corynebacterium sp. HS2168-gen11]|uniref:DEAD/DEAH box helicase n=1 Tax=Corynebacterium sp. HS2168-gen11 TaxID=2974027 RepID=UPI00216AFFD5|nr:DEAD/DEAH box helicase [Corynebacterium sp. HS2168-gen11]MCS4534891.1 DEAD/DEAH box helicase [Corynebacterium sp. HS2168-gen11]
MASHLLHALWLKSSGLHLWVEQTEGHKIVTPELIDAGIFPPAIDSLLRSVPFRHRVETKLLTPKGREVKLAMPTLAFAPEDAVKVLSTLASLNAVNTPVEQLATLAPDLQWLVHLYQGLESFVRAGRVTIKLHYQDHQWYPMWQLSTGLGERGWLAQMLAACPRVIIDNSGSTVAEDIAAELPHWITNAILRPLHLAPRKHLWHEFHEALLASKPLKRGNAALVSALNKWKDSVTSSDIQFVIQVEEPLTDINTHHDQLIDHHREDATSDLGDVDRALWAVRVLVRSGQETPIPVRLREFDRATKAQLEAMRKEMAFIAPNLGLQSNLALYGIQTRTQPTHESDILNIREPDHVLPANTVSDTTLTVVSQEYSFVSQEYSFAGFDAIFDQPETPALPESSLDAHQQELLRALQQVPHAGDFDVYLSTEAFVEFLNKDVPALRSHGYSVLVPKAWSVHEVHALVNVSNPTESTGVSAVGFDSIVNFNWKISIGDHALDDAEMAQLIASKTGLIQLRGKWVMADATSLKAVRNYMQKLAKTQFKHLLAKRDEVLEYLALLDPNSSRAAQLQEELAELEIKLRAEQSSTGELSRAEMRQLILEQDKESLIAYEGTQWELALLGQTTAFEIPAPTVEDIPDTVHASLRPYQHRGVNWIRWMAHNHIGGVLADDMGLGKTLQILTVQALDTRDALEHGHDRCITVPNKGEPQPEYGPSLVIAPTSVVGNWAREAKKFVPSLRVLVHHGQHRIRDAADCQKFQKYDLVITSYGTASKDADLLSQVFWQRVSLDEAQSIKNSATRIAKVVRAIPAKHRMALTGTPVENRLLELRALLDFCNPGMLGSVSFFRNHFSKPIEVTGDELVADKLRALTQPFILRRLKSDPAIVAELPEKEENIVTVSMTPEQAAMYQAYVQQLQVAIQQSEGMSRRGLILASLTKIKQICNHPAHFLGDGSPLVLKGRHRSGKVEELMMIVDNARANGEKILIFTQYKAFGDLLAPYLSQHYDREIPFLHGGVSKIQRDHMVETFQTPQGPPAMVLSLKAGGTGLNLTAANIVVHMDRWWNPAVENQATDRAYRIGQDKNVMVYKLITAGTLEERIQEIIQGKSHLANSLVTQGEGWLTELDDEQLAELLTYRTQES